MMKNTKRQNMEMLMHQNEKISEFDKIFNWLAKRDQKRGKKNVLTLQRYEKNEKKLVISTYNL